jgi:type VI protein secretion system component VasF
MRALTTAPAPPPSPLRQARLGAARCRAIRPLATLTTAPREACARSLWRWRAAVAAKAAGAAAQLAAAAAAAVVPAEAEAAAMRMELVELRTQRQRESETQGMLQEAIQVIKYLIRLIASLIMLIAGDAQTPLMTSDDL